MEIKIGVVHTSKELMVETSDSPETVQKAVEEALASAQPLVLVDEHQRRIVVPADKLAYVELGDPRVRRVGFGAS